MNFLTRVIAMIASFGSWDSPLTSDLVVEKSIRFHDIAADEEALYWTELHPDEKGRVALVKWVEGKETFLAKDRSMRTRVHEYGGGAFSLKEGKVIFSNDEDGQLYLLGEKPEKLTDAPNARFADGDGTIWVCETHRGEVVENSLVRIEEGNIHEIASGHDFYSNPRLSPDGKQLAFITWDFPNMQWDSSILWLADVEAGGTLTNIRQIAGGEEESVCQVQWSKEGILHYVSDATGFWNLYRLKKEKKENLCEMKAEFGIPGWVFGSPCYSFLPGGKIACMVAIKGVDSLQILDPETETLHDPKLPFTLVQQVVTHQGKVYFIGGSPKAPLSLISFDPKTESYEVIKQSSTVPLSEEWVSEGEIIEYPSIAGKKGYGFYYPPKNPNFRGPAGEKPPLIVSVHGGPTARSYNFFRLGVQFWTTRGFGFLDVNYGGSTGYGREYFKRLEGNWGILDVADCISAAKALVDKGLADPERLLIRGGSAGGYTVLAALTFEDVFAAGTSYYGVSDLELLYEDTHKFEAEYTDILVGKYPDEIDLIRERSPINHVEKISTPILLLQGDEDKVVPPNQAFTIYEALKKKGTPVGMLLFEGEGHGFRSAENIKLSLDAELYFYSEILGLNSSQFSKNPPVVIEGS